MTPANLPMPDNQEKHAYDLEGHNSDASVLYIYHITVVYRPIESLPLCAAASATAMSAESDAYTATAVSIGSQDVSASISVVYTICSRAS